MPSTCIAPDRSESISLLHRWLAILVLAVVTFIIVVTEFAPIGLLSSIAAELGESPATVGLVVSAYAWIGAGSAVLSAMLPRHVPRKPLLIVLMLLLAASNAMSAVATTFSALMLGRLAGALAHGVFWALVAALATQLAPARKMGLATSIVFGGVSVASVLGVPVVNLIGQAWSWRGAFGILSGLSLATALLMAVVLPKLEAQGSVGFGALLGVLRNRTLWLVYALAILTVSAHFGAFTFIEPYLRQLPDIALSDVASMLFAFGAAGLAGNVLAGLLIDRWLKLTVAASLLLMCVALFGLGAGMPRPGLALTLALLLAWGAAISALFVGIQTWVIRSGGTAAIPASAVYTAVFNASSGAGAVLGAFILERSGLFAILTAAGAATGGAVLLLVSMAARRGPRPA